MDAQWKIKKPVLPVTDGVATAKLLMVHVVFVIVL